MEVNTVTTYICSVCRKEFSEEKECIKHEYNHTLDN